jgi:hypothetical protein
MICSILLSFKNFSKDADKNVWHRNYGRIWNSARGAELLTIYFSVA